MARINITNATVLYDGKTVIHDQSIAIPEGSFFTILGPSGCGKTTILRLIAGFLQPSHGQVLFNDKDVTRLPPHRRDCGVVFQDYALFPDRTVFENVAYGLRARGLREKEVRSRVETYLDRVELMDFAMQPPSALSGGQRQRVALARALVIKPQVLLLDEPLSALDAKLAVEMQGYIRDIQREFGVTTVFVTHDQRMALTISDHVALLRSGRLEQVDAPQAIYDRPCSSYVADFIGSANLVGADAVQFDGEFALCRLGEHTVRLQRNGCHAGDNVKLCIREEAIRLAPPEQAKDPLINKLEAVVEKVTFLGEAFRIGLRLGNGVALQLVQQNGFAARVPELGATVGIHVSPDSCLVRD